MSKIYGSEHRDLQDRFGTRSLADRLEETVVHDFISSKERAFIESRDMLFLSTVDERGTPTVSYKGGDPGMVKVVDEKTLAFPIYNGNGMFLSTGNVCANPKLGLLFMDFVQPHRIRVHGSGKVDPADALIASWAGAEQVIRVAVEEVFVNCPRYVHRYEKVETSRFVPRAGEPLPPADWKRIDGLQDVLSEEERREAAKAGLLSFQEYEKLIGGD